MSSGRLVIFGNESTARIAHYYFSRESDYEVCAFTVDRQYIGEEALLGLPVVPFESVTQTFPPSTYRMFVAVGYARMNKVREEKYLAAKRLGYELASFVSPRCSFLTDHPVGDNCLIMEDNTIQPFVRIGSDVVMWSGNHIGHDAVIEDHCFVTSHVVVSGFTRIGHHSFLGVNATLRDAITIAPETLVGAGAVIMKDTIEKGVYLPERAKLFDKRSDEITISG